MVAQHFRMSGEICCSVCWMCSFLISLINLNFGYMLKQFWYVELNIWLKLIFLSKATTNFYITVACIVFLLDSAAAEHPLQVAELNCFRFRISFQTYILNFTESEILRGKDLRGHLAQPCPLADEETKAKCTCHDLAPGRDWDPTFSLGCFSVCRVYLALETWWASGLQRT